MTTEPEEKSGVQLVPAAEGSNRRNVLADGGRVIGNVEPADDGWDGETEHGMYLRGSSGRPFASAELAAEAVLAVWRQAEEGPVGDHDY